MLIFGPGNCTSRLDPMVPWIILNLTGMYTGAGGNLIGLYPAPQQLGFPETMYSDWGEVSKDIDIRYYNYVMNNPSVFSELMFIISNAVNANVFICISDIKSDPYISCINESLMKLIQVRYNFKYYIVNDPSDFDEIVCDGCEFGSVQGIQMYDHDRDAWILNSETARIQMGGGVDEPI